MVGDNWPSVECRRWALHQQMYRRTLSRASSRIPGSKLWSSADSEARFAGIVAPAVALEAHAPAGADSLQRVAIVAAGTLAAAVGVMKEPSCPSSRRNGHALRAEHQVSVPTVA